MDRTQRFALFVDELRRVAPAATLHEARDQLETILNRIEDAHSGAPFRPENWRDDGRMYPPGDDYERKSPFKGARLFRTRGHYVLIGQNGAIRISSAKRAADAPDAEIILDKAGTDGRCCPT
ncbi:MAG TPA: hypothetical protein VF552_12640 [Allosphingosinicella sp.]|jgi:hypothetical protein